MIHKPVVLAFSGHDPTGGAGIQADIETLAGTGCHCVSVITSLTAQNTSEFNQITPQTPARFREQLHLLTEEVTVDACKIGLIGSIELVEVIAAYLATTDFPVVLDPVLGSGTGTALASPELIREMIAQLFPRTTVITPNLGEAQTLTGHGEPERALHALLDLGCDTALITTSGQTDKQVTNTWMSASREMHNYHWDKLPGVYHGSGCTLSACLAGRLAQGDTIRSAVEQAQDYTWQALQHAQQTGKAQLHPDRFFSWRVS